MYACRRGGCDTASSDMRVILAQTRSIGFERRVTRRGVGELGACAVHASQGGENKEEDLLAVKKE